MSESRDETSQQLIVYIYTSEEKGRVESQLVIEKDLQQNVLGEDWSAWHHAMALLRMPGILWIRKQGLIIVTPCTPTGNMQCSQVLISI